MKPRQRSEISLSLASVLVISVKTRRLRLEGRGERLRRRLAPPLVGVLQQIERRLEGQLLAVDLEAQRGDGLVEQPVPGGWPVTDFSWNSCSILSSSWYGFSLRTSSSQGG